MIRSLLMFVALMICFGCKDRDQPHAQKQKALISYVDPFIGTGGHGHTYPGATLPFGMMQLSPDTRLDGWDGCSGYHYSDSYIYGFSHTHLSGTGVSDYGDILLMPTNKKVFHNGSDGNEGYRSSFSHEREEASPGYYRVDLTDSDIAVELTVSERAGIHRYEYPSSNDQWLILDLEHRDQLLDHQITVEEDRRISGYRFSKAWADEQRVYFDMEFSHPFELELNSTNDNRPTKSAFRFINPNNEPIYVRIGISAVDVAGARKNRETELKDKSFEQVKEEAQNHWERQLEKIIIEDSSEENKQIFYTSLYHTMLAPNKYQDVDGRYRGMDLKVHEATDFNYYTVFSLWDTYRAAHPLYTIIEQERTNDFIQTMLAKYREGGVLPIWDLSGNYTGCMIGYHAVPVIVDAYMKGIRNYNTEDAFAAIKHSAMQDRLGLKNYRESGFIPVEEESESVSKTLEYAYDDWTIAIMAKEMGKMEDYHTFIKRAQSYKNLYNPKTGFMQGRFRNTWFGPFDPYEVNFNYTEANAWQYSLYAPQDISGLIDLMGGKEKFEKHLDRLFTAQQKTSGREQADITGLIGQYAHGNEPSHHMAYLYNFVEKPAKTQRLIRQILLELYKNTPDGISGNEDCGQMSAWYVFSSLGFYPVTPGSNQYIIGSPLFKKASINLENGNTFSIIAENNAEDHPYIASATLNGDPLSRSYLYHDEIMNGGQLVLKMSNVPTKWATKAENVPHTEIEDDPIVLSPYMTQGKTVFKDTTTVALASPQRDITIYYRLDGGSYEKYRRPFQLSSNTFLETYAEKNSEKSPIMSTQFNMIDKDLSVELHSQYANEYSAGGQNAVIDGLKGTKDFRTGAWQGYWGKDVVAVIDRGDSKLLKSISINFLQDQRSWIFYPKKVMIYVAGENKQFRLSKERSIDAAKREDQTDIKTLHFKINKRNIKYIKVVAKNFGKLPTWHLGAPDGEAWTFIDEIEIE